MTYKNSVVLKIAQLKVKRALNLNPTIPEEARKQLEQEEFENLMNGGLQL